jgi:hypothetical protein
VIGMEGLLSILVALHAHYIKRPPVPWVLRT